MCGRDDFLMGLLSKQKGQILRVSAVYNMLFTMDSGEEIKRDISEAAIKAAINFTSTCLDHTCLISGRKIVADVIASLTNTRKQFHFFCMHVSLNSPFNVASTVEKIDEMRAAAHCLLLPGAQLHLTPLLNAKRFSRYGNKEGAVQAFKLLAKEGLGEVFETTGGKGTKVVCKYVNINLLNCLLRNIHFTKDLFPMKIASSKR